MDPWFYPCYLCLEKSNIKMPRFIEGKNETKMIYEMVRWTKHGEIHKDDSGQLKERNIKPILQLIATQSQCKYYLLTMSKLY